MPDYCECCVKAEPEVELLRDQIFKDRGASKSATITICRECNDKAHRFDRETWRKITQFMS